MTNRDIRDIAAYWGAPWSYSRGRRKRLNSPVLESLELRSTELPDFKLHLRLLMSLTDAEILECMRLVEQDETAHGFSFWDDTEISRHDNCIYVGADGKMVIDITGEISINRHYSCNTGAVISYLQSVGIYVPGTINPDFVKLI